MKLFKLFSYFSIIIFFGFLFSSSTSLVYGAETQKDTKTTVLATVNIQDASITEANGNTFKIKFNLTNREGLQTGVKYSVKLMSETTDKQYVVDQKVYPASLTLNEHSTTPISLVYTAPSILSGSYTIYIESSNESGFPFGLTPIGKVDLKANTKGIEILPSSCSLSVVGEKGGDTYTLLQGVDISSNESLKLTCKVKNGIEASVDATPMYETTHRTSYGDIMYASGGDIAPVTLGANSTKDISLILPKVAKPQSYNIRIWFKTGDTYSNSVVAHYVLRGASATIQNLSLDKDYYKKDDTAHLSFVWTPSADVFYGSRSSGSNVKDLVLKASIVDKNNKSCSEYISHNISNKDGLKVDIDVLITAECFNPNVSTTISDASGQVYDQKDFKVATTSTKDSDYVFMIILALLLIIFIVFVLLRNQNTDTNNSGGFPKATKALVLFFVIFAGFGFINTNQASADTMLISGSHDGQTESGAITVNINKSTYSPNESMTASWSFQYLNCSNGENSTAQIFKSAASVSASINGQSKDLPNNGNGSGSGSFKAEGTAGSYSAYFSGSVYEATGSTSIPYTVVSNTPAATASLSASPSSITSGQSSTLSWSSTNATSCTGSGFSANGTSGSTSVSPSNTTQYSITCYGSGASGSANTTVTVGGGGGNGGGSGPSVTLSANPTSVAYAGYVSTLTWTSSNANSCTSSGFSAATNSGNTSVYPTTTTTYSLTCINGYGNNTAYATVTVGGGGGGTPPTVNASANPSSIAVGETSTISWSSTNATSCYKSKVVTGTGGTIDAGGNGTSGSFSTGALSETTSYNIQCTGTGGTNSKQVTVTVGGGSTEPTATISANPSNTYSGGTSTITWNSTNADSCTRKITAPTTSTIQTNGPTSGSFTTGALTVDTTYKVDCKKSGVHATAETTVTIGSLPDPTGSISATTCSIALNASTCTSNVTWSTSNITFPQSVAVTRNNPSNTSVGTGGSGTNVSSTVKYGDSTFYVYYGGTIIAQTAINTACTTNTAWDGTKCASSVGITPTGTLTAANNSCNITSGNSTCAISFSWTTTNPISGVTSSVYKDGSSQALGTSNSGTANFNIPYAGGAYRLMHNNVELASKVVNAKCANGKVWNGSTCVNSGISGTLTSADSCIIAINASTCNVTNFAWSVSGSSSQSSVITRDGASGVLSNATNGSGVTFPIFYPSSTFRHTFLGNTLATKTVTASCVSGTTWNGTTCGSGIGVMTGNLSSSANTCTIPANGSSCTVLLTWTTINPVATSAVTYYAGTLATGNNSSSNAPIGYGGDEFYLYNNAVELDSVYVDAQCISGTAWNGSKCITVVAPVMTSDLGVVGSPCTIASGGSSCSVNINWTVLNPVGNTLLTRDGGGTISTNHTGSIPQTLSYGSTIFRLINDGDELDNVSPYAVCASGTAWNGTTCATVVPPGGPCTTNCPTSSINLSATSIFKGKKLDITWNSTNSSYCVGTNFNTSNATSGTVSVYPSATTTYTVTCYGTGGNVTFSSASDATIRVQSKILFYEL